jgi:acyl dehydratase
MDTTLAPVTVGEELPVFTRTTGFPVWNRFAAVNDEFVPIHMDDEAGRAAGMPGAFGMGNLQLAYLHNLVREWLGERGRILRMQCRFRSVNHKGQQVTARGRVTSVQQQTVQQQTVQQQTVQQQTGGLVVELDVWTEDQDGNQLAPGSCTVLIDTGLIDR